MKTYQDVLSEIRRGMHKAGGNLSKAVRGQLGAHIRSRRNVAYALTALLVSAAAASAYSAWHRGANPADTWATLVFGAGTVASGVLFVSLQKLWDDYHRAHLILILMKDATESEILQYLDRLGIKT